MKKTLIILILVLAYQFTNAQVKVLGRIEPNGATDKYPTHVDSLGRGGLMAAASWQERNAIPTARRKAGMLVRVKSASVDSTYTLGVGLANADWAPYAPTANITNINQIPARSYNDLQDKPIIPNDAELLHSTGSEVKNGDLMLDGMLVLRNNNQVSLSSVNNSYNGSLRGDGMQFSNLSGNIKTNFSNDGIWFKYNGNGQTVLRGQPVSSGFNTVELPITSGVLALTSDLPNVSGKANLTGGNSFAGNQTVNGNIGIAINNAYLINGSTALEASGGYLRLNQGSAFSNGVYTPSAFRVDGGFTSLGTGYFGGNVGIGTSTPTEKLDVNGGRIKVTSDEGVATIKGGEIVLGNLEGNSSQIKMDNTTIVASSAFPIEVGLPSYSGVLALTSQLDGKANLSGGNTFNGNQFIDNGYLQLSQSAVEGAFGRIYPPATDNSRNFNYYLPIGSGTLALLEDMSEKASLNGNNTFNGNQNVFGELKVINPEDESWTGKLWMDYDVLTLDGSATGNLKLNGGAELQVFTEMLSFNTADVRFSKAVSMEAPSININSPTTFSNNVTFGGNSQVLTLPNASGTLATIETAMEYVLAKAVVKTFRLEDGATLNMGSCGLLSKVYGRFIEGENTALKLPSNPIAGQVVEFYFSADHSWEYLNIQTATGVQLGLGNFINEPFTNHVSFKWTGSVWDWSNTVNEW